MYYEFVYRLQRVLIISQTSKSTQLQYVNVFIGFNWLTLCHCPFLVNSIARQIVLPMRVADFISSSVIAFGTDDSNIKFTQYSATFFSWPDEMLPSRWWRKGQSTVFSSPGLNTILNYQQYGCSPHRSIRRVGSGLVIIFLKACGL